MFEDILVPSDVPVPSQHSPVAGSATADREKAAPPQQTAEADRAKVAPHAVSAPRPFRADSELTDRVALSTLLRESWAMRLCGDIVEVLTDRSDTASVAQRAGAMLGGRRMRVRRVSRAAVQHAMLRSHGPTIADEISHGFSRRLPRMAAKSGPARWQRAVIVTILVLALLTVWFGEFEILLAAVAVCSCAATALNALAIRHGARAPVHVDQPLADEDLPTYTIMVPAYREAAVIADLIQALDQLDYPRHLLDVMILVEHHDPPTEEAAREAGLPPHMRIVRIPPGLPQTKPRTCNLGLMLAGGEYVVIFDAEDRPEPDQLRKAAARFATSGPDLACVQAKLLFANGSENLLTRGSELEYATRYEMIMPGLVQLDLPIPLGGTSNHFRTETLRKAGGWDAWNVTEDADLGMRLAALGYRTEMIDSVTWEEAVPHLGAWIRQRTRWFKGFLLTAGVHSRRPVDTWRRFGARGLVVLFGIVLGNVALAASQALTLLVPPLYLTGVLTSRHPILTSFTWLVALGGTLVWMALQVIAVRRSGRRVPWLAVLALPLFGLAQNWAAIRAMYQVVASPFQWEKTPHRTAGSQA